MRLLLIEKTGVLIQNGADSVSFKDLEELKFYSGVDFTPVVGNKRVGYEPDRGLHTEFDGANTVVKDLYAPYDNIIKNVKLLQTRKENPFYGLTGEALAKKEAEVAKGQQDQARYDEIQATKESAKLREYTVKQAEEWITKELTDAPNTVVGVKQAVGKILHRMLPYILER